MGPTNQEKTSKERLIEALKISKEVMEETGVGNNGDDHNLWVEITHIYLWLEEQI